MSVREALARIDAGDLQGASDLLEEALFADPDDVHALLGMARLMLASRRPAMARAVMMRAQALGADSDWRFHRLLGACEVHLQRFDSGEEALLAAREQAPEDLTTLIYLAMLRMEQGRIAEGEELADEIMRRAPGRWEGRSTKGFALLHRRRWGPGWDLYQAGLGQLDFRARHDYGLPDWNGEPGARLLVYGEQGIGDQLVWASSLHELPVAQLNCHPKLSGALKRSLPGVEVHGDQFREPIEWEVRATHQASMATVQRWVRRSPEDYPGTPWLVPCPGRARYWRERLSEISGRPRIGLAWTGGTRRSAGSRERSLQLPDLDALFELDADIISLEYRDRSEEVALYEKVYGRRLHQFPEATCSDDLDDVIALISALDVVVCVPTTVYHVAGSLGIPAHVIVHSTPHYHEGIEGPCPYWQSVTFHRRPELGDAEAIRRAVDGARHAAESQKRGALVA